MTVTSATGGPGLPDPTGGAPVSHAAESRELARAVRKLNDAAVLPDSRELSMSIDPKTKIPVVRVLDAVTHEVLDQLPAEYVLRVTAFLESQAAQNSFSKPVPDGR